MTALLQAETVADQIHVSYLLFEDTSILQDNTRIYLL